MKIRVALCKFCAEKLRTILAAEGEETMAKKLPGVLCHDCFERSGLKRTDTVVLAKAR